MFPLRDENPTDIVPVTTVLLIAVTVGLWWYLQAAGFSTSALAESICRYGAIPAEVTGQGVGPAAVSGPCRLGGLTWQALVTSMFLHGSWMHLIGNMWFLWIFGNNVEDAMGHGRFLVFYVLAGVLAAAAQVLSAPASAAPMVGASGAIAAVMGAYLVLYPKARVDTLFFFLFFIRIIPLPAWLMLGYWMAIQLVASQMAEGAGGGVAYMAHVGGFVAGLLLILVFRDRERLLKRPAWAGRQERPW